MKRTTTLITLIATLSIASVANTQYYSGRQIQEPGSGRVAARSTGSETRVDQNLNDYIPLNLKFKDSDGENVELRDYFNERPVILMPVFYDCAGVCTLELNNMVDALYGFKKDSVGKEFDVITFTIKPTETTEMAKDKKNLILDIYSRKGAEKGWHFLTGDYDQIRKLTNAIGFNYTYDDTNGNITHPAAAVILTPEGQISQYFLETTYPQQILLDSIKKASKGRIGKKTDATSWLSCIKIDPLTGERSLNIIKLVNILGVATLLILAFAIVRMTIKYKSSEVAPANGGHEG